MNTHNLCFEQKYEKIVKFLSENFHFLVVKFSVYFNWNVFLMKRGLKQTLRTPSGSARLMSVGRARK